MNIFLYNPKRSEKDQNINWEYVRFDKLNNQMVNKYDKMTFMISVSYGYLNKFCVIWTVVS